MKTVVFLALAFSASLSPPAISSGKDVVFALEASFAWRHHHSDKVLVERFDPTTIAINEVREFRKTVSLETNPDIDPCIQPTHQNGVLVVDPVFQSDVFIRAEVTLMEFLEFSDLPECRHAVKPKASKPNSRTKRVLLINNRPKTMRGAENGWTLTVQRVKSDT